MHKKSLPELLGIKPKYKITVAKGVFLVDDLQRATLLEYMLDIDKHSSDVKKSAVEVQVDFKEPTNFIKLMELEISYADGYKTTLLKFILNNLVLDKMSTREDVLDELIRYLKLTSKEEKEQIKFIKQACQEERWGYGLI